MRVADAVADADADREPELRRVELLELLELPVVGVGGGGPESARAARYALGAAGGLPGGLLGLVVDVSVALRVAVLVGDDPGGPDFAEEAESVVQCLAVGVSSKTCDDYAPVRVLVRAALDGLVDGGVDGPLDLCVVRAGCRWC